MTKKIGTDLATRSAPASTHTAGAIFSQQSVIAKRFQTLRAELALAGFECRECVEGGFFVSRWNLTKFCPAIADLEQFAGEVLK
jgi:hypothetical protein